MRRNLKFHLFPEAEIKWIPKHPNLKQEMLGKNIDAWKIMGLSKTPNMQLTEKNGKPFWVRGEPVPDSEGRFWWEGPDLIAIVHARRSHKCDCCGERIESIIKRNYSCYRKVAVADYYIGITDGCLVQPWGYDSSLCLKCALEILGDTQVFNCTDFSDDCGWYKEAPKVENETFIILEIIKEFLPNVETPDKK